MKEHETTAWFAPNVKPARNGIYQRLYDEGTNWQSIHFCKYHNGQWFVGSRSPRTAREETATSPWNLKWRGLAQDPSKQ